MPTALSAIKREVALEAVGGNFDLIQTLLPYVREAFALLSPSRSGGGFAPSSRVERDYILRLFEFVYTTVDPNRPYDPSRPCELERHLHAHVLKYPNAPAAALQAACWQVVDRMGGKPQLTLPGPLLAALPAGVSLPLGTTLLSLALNPTGSDGGRYGFGPPPKPADADQEEELEQVMRGQVRISSQPPPPTLQLSAADAAMVQGTLVGGVATLQMVASLLLMRRSPGASWLQVEWRPRNAGWLPAPGAEELEALLRRILPPRSTIVAVGGVEAAAAEGGKLAEGGVAALKPLLRALQAGGEQGVEVAAPHASLAELLRDSLTPTPVARVRGLDVKRTKAGGVKLTAARRRASSPTRNVYKAPPEPPAARGEAQPLLLYLHHPDLPPTRGLSGLPKVVPEDPGGVQYFAQQLTIAQRMDEDAAEGAMLFAPKIAERQMQMRRTIEAVGTTLLAGSSGTQRMEAPKKPGGPRLPKAWPASTEQFEWSGPYFVSSGGGARGGALSGLRLVQLFVRARVKEAPARARVNQLLLEVHRCEEQRLTFDWTRLTAPSSAAADEPLGRTRKESAKLQQQAGAASEQQKEGAKLRALEERLARLKSERVLHLNVVGHNKAANQQQLEAVEEQIRATVAEFERLEANLAALDTPVALPLCGRAGGSGSASVGPAPLQLGGASSSTAAASGAGPSHAAAGPSQASSAGAAFVGRVTRAAARLQAEEEDEEQGENDDEHNDEDEDGDGRHGGSSAHASSDEGAAVSDESSEEFMFGSDDD